MSDTPDHINRAARALSLAPWADLTITEQVRWLNAAGRLAEADLLASPTHDAMVAAKALRAASTVLAKFARVASTERRREGWLAAAGVLEGMAEEVDAP